MTDHVVIAGGGIAGTMAALALRTAGIPATVIEARAAGDDSGAVVRLNPNGMDALRAVGAHQAVIAVSSPLVRVERYGADGRRVSYRLAADPASVRGMPRVLAWHRLSSALREQAVERGAVFRHGARVVGAEETGTGVRVTLDDGTRIGGDVLVGADGVRSTVRPLIDADAPEPQHRGTRTVYGYTPDPGVEPPPPEVLRAHIDGRRFIALTRNPFTGGCFWFTSLPAPEPYVVADTDTWRAELLETFDGNPAAPVIERAERILPFDDHALAHLPRWHTERMIVIGDAVHVAPPASEQGAAMAVEDGVLLARCLRDAATPAAAFAEFEKLRRDRVEAVVALGTGGTRRAHASGIRRIPRLAKEKLDKLAVWRPPPTGGPAWAFDHHIDW